MPPSSATAQPCSSSLSSFTRTSARVFPSFGRMRFQSMYSPASSVAVISAPGVVMRTRFSPARMVADPPSLSAAAATFAVFPGIVMPGSARPVTVLQWLCASRKPSSPISVIPSGPVSTRMPVSTMRVSSVDTAYSTRLIASDSSAAATDSLSVPSISISGMVPSMMGVFVLPFALNVSALPSVEMVTSPIMLPAIFFSVSPSMSTASSPSAKSAPTVAMALTCRLPFVARSANTSPIRDSSTLANFGLRGSTAVDTSFAMRFRSLLLIVMCIVCSSLFLSRQALLPSCAPALLRCASGPCDGT